MSLFQYIESIEDHRVDANKDYELADIIFLTIAAVRCGAKDWKAIRIFGEDQLDWLREYRDFSKGIPTRHSIGRIIRWIKAENLVSSFITFQIPCVKMKVKSILTLMVKSFVAQSMVI
ncbi:MAG: transposase family protein [Alteromonadales bacterium]|nr:transposase family protein [Alteromonadales bacterium]